MVTRFDDWVPRLSAYIADRQNMDFEWAVHDCMAFVAKCVEALTGTDFFQDFSDYTDEASAKVMLENNGGPFGIINTCLGMGSKDILSAGRGDVVVVDMPEGLTGGIVDDSGQFITLISPEGLRRVPLDQAIRVWSY